MQAEPRRSILVRGEIDLDSIVTARVREGNRAKRTRSEPKAGEVHEDPGPGRAISSAQCWRIFPSR
jgi:hypothetical protein